MPTITFGQLNGKGILNPDDFVANKTYNITMGAPTCSGSAYFTMEAVRDANGFYDGLNSARPGRAKFLNFVGTNPDTLIGFKTVGDTEYKWSIVIPPEGGTFDFVPFNATIFANTVFLRGTGGITFTYGEAPYIFSTKTQLQFAVNLWITDNTAALATYGEINTWVTTAITDMNNLFLNKTTFNSDISNWDVSNVVSMESMFESADAFDQPLNDWDVSSVTSMNKMFSTATNFNQPIGDWTLSSITNLSFMFRNAVSFDQPIGDWDVSNVTNMEYMFANADIFNQDISNWDVSSVTTMQNMFDRAELFNKPLNNWDVSNVTDIRSMFSQAYAFQQPLNLWTPNSLSAAFATQFMGLTGNVSAINYTLLDTLLNGWVVDFAALPSNVTISFGDSTFTSAGLAARNILVNDKGWTITDGGQV